MGTDSRTQSKFAVGQVREGKSLKRLKLPNVLKSGRLFTLIEFALADAKQVFVCVKARDGSPQEPSLFDRINAQLVTYIVSAQPKFVFSRKSFFAVLSYPPNRQVTEALDRRLIKDILDWMRDSRSSDALCAEAAALLLSQIAINKPSIAQLGNNKSASFLDPIEIDSNHLPGSATRFQKSGIHLNKLVNRED